MTDPKRVERLWLAIAVATLWLVSVVREEDAKLPVSSFEVPPEAPSNSPQKNLEQSLPEGHDNLSPEVKQTPLQSSFEAPPEVKHSQPQMLENGVESLPETQNRQPSIPKQSGSRFLSCFRRGLLIIRAAFANHDPLPLGRFFSEPWPSFTTIPHPSLANFSSA